MNQSKISIALNVLEIKLSYITLFHVRIFQP